MFVSLALVLLVIAFRVVVGIVGSGDLHGLHNFSPLAAVALCGAIYFPRRVAYILPLGALLVSDIALNAHYHLPLLSLPMIPQYLALAATVALGAALRPSPPAWSVLLSAFGGSLFFFIVTNTGAWWANPVYAKTAAGWLQALTTGQPGFPSTLAFYRHTLVSDLLFTALFVAAVRLPVASSKSRASAGAANQPT